MAIPTFTPPVDVSLDSERKVEIKRLEASFGDGYEQHGLQGTNAVRHVWELIWENLSVAEATAIDNFFISTASVQPFYWTSPYGDTKKYKVKPDWSRKRATGNTDTIRATLRQDFTLEV